MSKQKFRISKKRSNFSMISNTVSQVLNYDLAALGLYVYLFSLPHDWEFHKSHLRKVCSIGEKKLNNLLRILAQHKLVKIAQIRKENGQFAHFDIQIDDGSSFTINTLDEIAQPDGIFCRTVENGGAVKQIYKEHINKNEIIKEKDKSICASDDALKKFNEFWFVYPRKKDKARAKRVWLKNECYKLSDKILEDIKIRIMNDQQWSDIQFVPYPATYLEGERWQDDLELKKSMPTGKEKDFSAIN